jgi:integrase
MFLLIGINFQDLVLLNEGNLHGDRIIYTRSKTKKQYSIRLLAPALEIINYFRAKSAKTLLGILKEDDLNDKGKLPYIIHQRNKVFNAHLGKIGKLIDLNFKLTGYCFRYTSANIAKQLGYSKDLISEALGHSYGSKVTGIYLEAYDLKHIDDMNEDIYNHITSM